MGRYTTVEPVLPDPKPLGSRNDSTLRAIFSSTPTYNEYSAEAVANAGFSSFNGAGGPGDKIPNIGVTNGVVNDAGYTFGTFNLNYTESPNFGDVVTGDGGLPASAWVPNLTSPGEGNGIDPTTKPEFPVENLPDAGVEFGIGLGSTTNPATTTSNVASQKIGSYIMGRSYLGSDGTS